MLMETNKHIIIEYEGEHINIGRSVKNNQLYIHPKESCSGLWFRFSKEYYSDHTEYMKDYNNFLNKDNDVPHC